MSTIQLLRENAITKAEKNIQVDIKICYKKILLVIRRGQNQNMLGRSSHLVLFFSDDASLAALTTFRHHPNICKLQINIQFSKHWILSKFYSMLRVWGFMEVELVLAGYSCWKSLLAGNNFYSGGPSGRGGDPRWEIATNRFCTCTCTYIHVHCTYICYYLDFTYISSHITCTIYIKF